MNVAFLLAATVTVAAALLAVTRVHPVYVLLYMVISFLGLAVMLFMLGAAFAGVLHIIIYAGAIVVLFLFVLMLLDIRSESLERERLWLAKHWLAPALLTALLFGEMTYVLAAAELTATSGVIVTAVDVGERLFGPFVLGVEMVSVLLLAGLVSAYHLGRQATRAEATTAQLRPDLRTPLPEAGGLNVIPERQAGHRAAFAALSSSSAPNPERQPPSPERC